MISKRTGLTRLIPGLLALLIVCMAPAALLAESFQFRNECNAAVVVQTTMVIRGVPKRDQYPLKPGDATPKLPLEVERLVTISDPRTGKMLFKDVLPVSQTPLAYRIVPNPAGGVRLLKVTPPAPNGK